MNANDRDTHYRKFGLEQAGASVNRLYKSLIDKRDVLQASVPKSMVKQFNISRTIAVIAMDARRNPDILLCSLSSLLMCISNSLAMGLEPGGALGHSYIVPRFKKGQKEKDATLIIGYRGYVELARRSGQVTNVEAHCVYENDEFKVVFGSQSVLYHEPYLLGDRGPVVAAHCKAEFKDGGGHYEFMTRADIEKIRDRDGGHAWKDNFEEMAKKTVVRRASKYWPMSTDIADFDLIDDVKNKEVEILEGQREAQQGVAQVSQLDKARRGVAAMRQALEPASTADVDDNEPPTPQDEDAEEPT